jgi:hypothetical protein
MNRVYLLLRNNKQSGPHSLDELIALAPKPFDLIWVEGKSVGWSYPTEIEGLKTYITATEPIKQGTQVYEKSTSYAPAVNENPSHKIPPVNIHVSLPSTVTQLDKTVQDTVPAYNLEKRAEELRKKVQEFTAKSSPRENKSQTKYTRSLEAIEEDYTHWTYRQKIKKKKSFSKKNLSIAALFIALASGSYFLVQSFSNTNALKVQQDAVQPQSPRETPNTTSVETVNIETKELATIVEPNNSLVKENNNTAKINEKKESNPIAKPSVNSSIIEEIVDEKTKPALEDKPADMPQTQEEVVEEPIMTVPKEKKKTLAEKIDGFLDKIGSKKQKEPVLEDQTKTSEDGSERKSKRRDDETTTPVEVVDLATLVDIIANNPDNWMMGVKGLKLTLRNRSNEIIKTATVEIRYYNEQNSLLEKKLVYFTNIPPKKSLTIEAPAQRLADHADFKLLAISTTEDSYAKQ